MSLDIGLGRASDRSGESPGPESAAGTTPARAVSLLGGTCLVLALAGTSLARQGWVVFDTAYAEDAKVFLADALRLPVAETFMEGYAGYLHSLPRLLAALVALLPVEAAAMVLATGSALVVGALGLVVFRASGSEVQGRLARVVLVVAMVSVPVGQEEVFNNLANLHWFLMFTAAWVLLWWPATRWGLVVGTVVLVLAGLSDPLTVLLVPLVAVRIWRSAGPGTRLFPAAWLAGTGLQLAAVATGAFPREATALLFDPLQLGTWFGFRVLARGVVGSSSPLGDGSAIALAVAGSVLVLVGWEATRRWGRADGRTHLLVASFAVAAVAFHTVPSFVTGASPERYAVVPILLLVSAAVVLADRTRPPAGRPGRGRPQTAVLAIVGVLWALNLPLANSRDTGPTWSAGLEGARPHCSAGAEVVSVPVVPAGWTAEIPCAELGEGTRGPR